MTNDEYQRERMATWRAVVTGILACPEPENEDDRTTFSGVVEAADRYLTEFDARFKPVDPEPKEEPVSEWSPCSKEEALENHCSEVYLRGLDKWVPVLSCFSSTDDEFRTRARKAEK